MRTEAASGSKGRGAKPAPAAVTAASTAQAMPSTSGSAAFGCSRAAVPAIAAPDHHGPRAVAVQRFRFRQDAGVAAFGVEIGGRRGDIDDAHGGYRDRVGMAREDGAVERQARRAEDDDADAGRAPRRRRDRRFGHADDGDRREAFGRRKTAVE
jgi:hypothetical protein